MQHAKAPAETRIAFSMIVQIKRFASIDRSLVKCMGVGHSQNKEN